MTPAEKQAFNQMRDALEDCADALHSLMERPVTEDRARAALSAAKAVPAPTHRTTGWVAPVDRYTVPVLFNPYTGEPRDVRDVQSDPQGILIAPLGKVEMLAANAVQPEPPSDENISDAWISASDSDGIAYDGPSFERGYRLGRGEYDEYTGALVAAAKAVSEPKIKLIPTAEELGTPVQPQAQADRKSWLIEITAGAIAPAWLCGPDMRIGWTKNANAAISFPSNEVAEEVFARLMDKPRWRSLGFDKSCYAITEHLFVDAHPQASEPAGWKLVPVEPTQEMLDAVVTTLDDHLLGSDAEKQYREDWAAMLAAAPEATK